MPRLELMPEDVLTGRRGQPRTCPIARRIERAGFVAPYVSGGSIRLTVPETGVRHSWPATAAVRRFMAAFDGIRDPEERRLLALLPFAVDLPWRDSHIVSRPAQSAS